MVFRIFFTAGTALFVYLSWVFSIRARRYHGIARFFAFEGILALFLLNVRFWFDDPFSLVHILAWISLVLSLALAVHSAYLPVQLGRPDGQIENTTRLVVRGAYRLIRHPLYASLGLLGLGIFLKRVTELTTILVLIVLLAVYVTAKIEEKEMRARFGGEYEAYMRTTKMFIPFIL